VTQASTEHRKTIRTQLTFALPVDAADALHQRATALDRSMSYVLRSLVFGYLGEPTPHGPVDQ
jgi:hypothetical protein